MLIKRLLPRRGKPLDIIITKTATKKQGESAASRFTLFFMPYYTDLSGAASLKRLREILDYRYRQ